MSTNNRKVSKEKMGKREGLGFGGWVEWFLEKEEDGFRQDERALKNSFRQDAVLCFGLQNKYRIYIYIYIYTERE